MIKQTVDRIIRRKRGVLLDISWGGDQQPNSVRMGPGGDIDHVPTKTPFPLPNRVVHTCVAIHICEFLEQKQFFTWFNELHRVMRPGGVVYLSGPYGGDESIGWLSDPEHRTRIVEATFAWLDPRTPIYALHETLGRKTPKPWHVIAQARVPGTLGTISYNCTLQAQPNGHR